MSLPPGQADLIHDGLQEMIEARGLDVDRAALRQAFDFSYNAHGKQLRASGEPYMVHPVEVVKILIELLDRRVDTTLLGAALLHDVVEDTKISIEEIESAFGPEIAHLVDGVTKITGFEFANTESEQAENFRKMLMSMARDIRVILIKLGDRLHNMRTLDYLAPEKAQRIARETQEIYAPLAHRLGIGTIKWELEDLSFKHLNRTSYKELVDQVAMSRAERERLILAVQTPIMRDLGTQGIRAEISGRPKHLYSIHRKMVSQSRPFSEIFDLLGVRVIVPKKADCYRVLGVLHDLFTPVHERFKDYIATPKGNMYQSLHTTVIGPEHKMVEIQIRTNDMHKTAELGIAAHYSYKEGHGPDAELDQKLGSLFGDAGFWSGDTSGDPGEFLDFLKTSLYQEEVFVFTPKGELKHLPKGSTPLDLAYQIHTDIGNKTVGARVGGKIVSLKYELKNGDSVQIITSPSAHPTDEWLSIVKSSRARQKVRRWLTEQRMEHSVNLGRDMLEREGRRFHKKLPGVREMIDTAQSFGFPDVERLLRSVGEGHTGAHNVLTRIYPEIIQRRDAPTPLEKIRDFAVGGGKGIRIQDVGNLMIVFARCCQPVPGDQVIGVVTRGRGLSVHRIDCPNGFEDKVGKDRRTELNWDVSEEKAFIVKLIIHGDDRQSFLADVANAVSGTKTNIKNADIKSVDGEALGIFLIEVKNLAHLQRVIKAIRNIRGVTSVERHQVLGEDEGETRH
ncbi:MAG: bifunctional (p)ppGpp synthetase/guanosine-3',5'-bis(diphosphate) 3'-pyrophosphohydrolase [Candidatus Eisenbacteria bacterium]|nr:bifunctional (p)ppGpp synthetase/guanosine-3',5'-bis(diphosphate) 3'-pyrophosphohydrolase [Candidatus Eisenbacteria bacterium]